jgi:hypothetical protein
MAATSSLLLIGDGYNNATAGAFGVTLSASIPYLEK